MFVKLELAGSIDRMKFKETVTAFYQTCIDYIKQWDAAFKDIEHFEWVLLRSVPSWQSIEKSLAYVNEFRADLQINNGDLFDELVCVKSYADVGKINSWIKDDKLAGDKWVEIFNYFDEKNIGYKNILKLIEFSLCLPASNGPTERVFSISNNMWTSEKSQLKVDTLQSLLITKINFQMSCAEFRVFLSNRNDILKKIHSTEKYQK